MNSTINQFTKRRNEIRPFRAGWSLLELIIVIVLMGILGSVGTMKFVDSLSYHRVNAAALRLSTDINAMQRQARVTAQTTSVQLGMPSNSYTLIGVQNPDRPALANPVVSLQDGVLKATFGTISLTGGGTTITFNGYGIPNKGGTITLQSGSATKQVSVSGTSGIAEILP